MTTPADTVLDLYRAGMVSRKHVTDTLGINFDPTPRATGMEGIGDLWVVSFDDVIWVDSRYTDFIAQNISGGHKKDPDGQSWGFESKEDATLFLLRFK
jgi:hypothetical protein